MKRAISLVIILALTIITTSVSTFADENVISNNSIVIENNSNGIPDKNLYKIILRKLGKNETHKFTKEEVESITELGEGYYPNTEIIKTLKGIENLTGLTKLIIPFNRISSLSGIENLTKLTVLNLQNNKITDLTPLKNLINTTATINYNKNFDFL